MASIFDDLPILYGLDSGGASWFVDDVANGLDCGCVCPSCGQPLVAKNQGFVRGHHFAHKGSRCKWAVESIATMLARQAIERRGAMFFPTLTYYDAVNRREIPISASRKLRVTSIEDVAVDGRQAPALLVTCRAGDEEAIFAVVVTLSHALKDGQASALYDLSNGVVLVDLKEDYEYESRKEGRHFDRDELAMRYQGSKLIERFVVDGNNYVSSWVRNKTRDAKEKASRVEAAELQRKREEEAAVRRRQEEERRQREEAERQRRAALEDERLRREREERKRLAALKEERRQREAAELQRLVALEEDRAKEAAAKEVQDGVVLKPMRRVTSEPNYNLESWFDNVPASLLALTDGICVANGELEAFICFVDDGARKAVLRAQFGFNPIAEIASNLDSLRNGFDVFEVCFDTTKTEETGSTTVVSDTADGIIVSLASVGTVTRNTLLMLQWLRHRVPVTISVRNGHSGTVDSVDVDACTVTLTKRR